MDRLQVILRFSCFLSLCFLLNLSACSTKKETSGSESVTENTDEFRTYKIDIEANPIPVFNIIEEVELIRLEETPESLLSKVSDLRFGTDIMVILGLRGDVLLYNSDGTFIRKFNAQGQGPEEYRYVAEFWVDEAINIYDADGGRIQQYDFEGNYLSSTKVPYRGDYIYPLISGEFVVDMNPRSTDSINHNLVLLDDNFNKTAYLNPYQENERTKTVFTYSKSLSPYKEGILYHKNMTDTIFFMQNGTISPLVTYDFGKDWVWNIESITSDKLAIRNATMEGEYVWRTISKIDENHIFLQFVGGSKLFKYVLIDRRTNKPMLLDLRKTVDTNFNMAPVKWDNGSMIFNLVSTDLEAFLLASEDVPIKFKGSATQENIESSENPVLVRLKFKRD